MNRIIIVASVFASCLHLRAAVPLRWTVETSRLQPVVFDAVRGETLALEAAFQSYGTPLAMAGKDVRVFYQTNGMGSAWWTAPARVTVPEAPSPRGAVATNAIAAAFTPAMDPGGSVVHGFLGSTGDIYRAAFTLRFRPGPGAIPNVIDKPPRVLDLGATTVINPPWPTDETIASRIRTVIAEDGITAGTNENDVRAIVNAEVGGTNTLVHTTDPSFVSVTNQAANAREKTDNVCHTNSCFWTASNVPTGVTMVGEPYVDDTGEQYGTYRYCLTWVANGTDSTGFYLIVDGPTVDPGVYELEEIGGSRYMTATLSRAATSGKPFVTADNVPSTNVIQAISRETTSNIVTRSFVESLGITAGGGVDTNAVIEIVTRTNIVGFTEWTCTTTPSDYVFIIDWIDGSDGRAVFGKTGWYTYSLYDYEFHFQSSNENATAFSYHYDNRNMTRPYDVVCDVVFRRTIDGGKNALGLARLVDLPSTNDFLTASSIQSVLTTNSSGVVGGSIGIASSSTAVPSELTIWTPNATFKSIELSSAIEGAGGSSIVMHPANSPSSPMIVLEDTAYPPVVDGVDNRAEIVIGDVHVRSNLNAIAGTIYTMASNNLVAFNVAQNAESKADEAKLDARVAVTNSVEALEEVTNLTIIVNALANDVDILEGTATAAQTTANEALATASGLDVRLDTVESSISGGIKNPEKLVIKYENGNPPDVEYDGSAEKEITLPFQYTDQMAIHAASNALYGDISGKADAGTVTQLGTQVAAIGSLLNGDDAHFVSTNYDSVVRLPEAYVEIKQNGNWLTIWKEMTRWDRFVGDGFDWSTNSWSGFYAWSTNVTSELSFKAERNWGMYDSETGGLSPEGYTQISSSNILIASGMAYQRTITSDGAAWILQCNSGSARIGGDTNGFFRVLDSDGNVQFEIVKGDRREMGADATGITSSGNTLTIPYSVDAAEHPIIRCCNDLSNPQWKVETDPDCLANVTWSGSSGAYVATVTTKSTQTKFFVTATYMSGGETYIRNAAPVSMTSIYLFGTKYYLTTNTISGKLVLTLSTTAPAN